MNVLYEVYCDLQCVQSRLSVCVSVHGVSGLLQLTTTRISNEFEMIHTSNLLHKVMSDVTIGRTDVGVRQDPVFLSRPFKTTFWGLGLS